MGKSVRLDKYLADAGTGTRSEVKKYIQKGMVQVNGETIRHPECKVQASEDLVTLAGETVGAAPDYVYYLLHKPAGCVSATQDNLDQTVMDYVPSQRKGLFPVGRLDKDTEGLLLITDDGALAHELLSPKKHVEKTYYAKVEGVVTAEDVQKFLEGVDIGEKNLTMPAHLEIVSAVPSAGDGAGQSEILLTISEGKFHQVKRMLEAVGKKVTYLRRISMGPIALPEDLKPGKYRELTVQEVEQLKSLRKK